MTLRIDPAPPGEALLSPEAGYRLSSVLGEGPEWILARAFPTDMGEGLPRPVLLRLLRKRFPSPRESALLRHELELTRELDVPGVVRGRALVEREHQLFLILDDPGGPPLRSFPMPLREGLVLGVRLATILAELHRRHIVHRNIQPGNLFFEGRSGRLWLTGFTLASSLRHEWECLRSPAALAGSLLYMSPEQTGRANRAVDYRTDFYSAGVTLYQCLTGCLPFEGDDPMEIIHGHLARRPVRPCEVNPDIPPVVSAIVERLLAKTADERYQSALGWKVDLERCLATLDREGNVPSFPLGQADRAPGFRIPQRLYGREAERERLLDAFGRVARGGSSLVGVAGPSGIGKTFLVQELHPSMVGARGWFVAGKFDLRDLGVPFAGLIQAFSDLVRQLLTEPPGRVADWRSRIVEALGPNGQVMVEVVPDLALLLGEQPPIPSLPPSQAQARFTRVFLDFVRVFARAEHPLVVFLDDLQWADAATLKWMQLLLGDPDCRHVLLIAAWRDNEIQPSHPLPVILEELRRSGTPVETLTLGPLEPAEVRRMVGDTFGGPSGPLEELADLLWHKTHGNPFFVHQLLNRLSAEALVSRADGTGEWRFDLAGIRALECSDNVVEFMAGEVARLPKATQDVLALASCFGNRFGLYRLASALGHDVADTAVDLSPAVGAGLLVPQSDSARYLHARPAAVAPGLVSPQDDVSYRFLHDRVRQAVDDLLDDARRRALHLRIGRQLLETTPEEQLEARVFDIVGHLNQAVGLITQADERRRLARLNLLAGCRGRDTTAYEAALEHLALGCSLLGPAAWETDADLAFSLHKERALCEGLCGHLPEADALFTTVQAKAHTMAARLEAGIDQVALYTVTQRKSEGVRLGLRLLEDAGEGVPARPTSIHVAAELLRARWHRGGRAVADLADRPVLDDATRVGVANLLMELCKPAYTLGEINLLAVLFLRLVNLSLRHGNTGVSSFGYNMYGMVLGREFGAYETGLDFGRMALELNRRLDDRRLRSVLVWQMAFALLPWRSHVRDSMPYYRDGYLAGVQCGDTFYAAASVCCMEIYSSIAGVPQEQILEQVEQYRSYMKWSRERNYYHAHLLVQQDALCLLGRTASPTSLDTEPFNEEAWVAEMEADQYLSGLCFHAIGRLRRCYLFGDLAGAVEAARRARETIIGLAFTLFEPELCFYDAMLSLAVLPDCALVDRLGHWRRVRANLKRLVRWSGSCRDNFLHKRLLVEAEMAFAQGRDEQAIRLYGRAADEARRADYLQHEALAYERTAAVHRARGGSEAARTALRAACYVYRKWGALAKVAQLEQTSPELMDAPRDPHDSSTPAGTIELEAVSALDAWSLVRATQSLSTEISVAGLLANLLARILENAGAERVVLLLMGPGELGVAAEGGVDREATVHDAPRAMTGCVPLSVVHYVERTGRATLLDDATRDALFGGDDYVASVRPRSVLCAPILNQGRLTGLVYLENRLIAGAFTPERLETLQVLAAQAAISIENARLVEQLEEANRTLELRVTQRTEELSETNQRLVETNARLKATQNELVQKQKMAWMGTLTQGIAHELRNPLGLVKNFAEISLEMVGELRTLLASGSGAPTDERGPGTQGPTRGAGDRDDDAARLLARVERNMGRIREHSVRADAIVTSMLLQSPDGTTDRTQAASVNALLTTTAEAVLSRRKGDRVRLVLELDPAVAPLEVRVRDLSMAFTNLLQNALDALEEARPSRAPGDAPCITVRSRERGTHVEARIRDNGPGIAPENVERIFTPFFTTRGAGRGTGLGLALTYEIIVHGHGGAITVDTEVGHHCEFVVRLPRGRPVEAIGTG